MTSCRILGALFLASSLLVSGCSAAASEDATEDSAPLATSTTPAFSFQPDGEGTSASPEDANLTNAAWLAWLSFTFYKDSGTADTVRDQLHQVPELEPVVFQWFVDDQTAATAFYLRTATMAALVFKGTNPSNLTQYEIFADVGLEATDVGHVYSGFLNPFRRLWREPGEDGAGGSNDIRAFVLADRARSNVPLYVTAHSLGGMFSNLAAAYMLHDADFAQDGAPPFQAAYTFGAARTGDADFSDDLITQCWSQGAGFYRFVYDMDPVPGLAPPNPLAHPGRKLADVDLTSPEVTHEEDALVFLGASGDVSYGADGEANLDASWNAPLALPNPGEHMGYKPILAQYQ